jgi:alkanesulfonate monooxygenase SsuD/methylene tetrahydromethanopterin reductase-like flavin-dependent oxidoreductase (luciferase family)
VPRATRTKHIRLTSAVTVLSAADPVRVFQEFAILDLISHGRAEIVAGRGSSVEAYPLFGFDLDDYDSLFSEKLDLLLNIRENTRVRWTGKHRAAGLNRTPTLQRLRRLKNFSRQVWLAGTGLEAWAAAVKDQVAKVQATGT